MAVLIIAILSIIFDALAFIPALGFMGIAGFVLGVCAWVLGRKIYILDPSQKMARIAMFIGIIGTFFGLVSVLLSFIIGGLFGSFAGLYSY